MRRPRAIAAGCLALALLSTLLPWALAFDPEAWLVWGRESLHLDLATTGGPSWKPLPVLFTTPLALLGGAAPWAWLVVARTGALLGLAGAWAVTCRLTGSRAAAAGAVVLMALSPWWAFNGALGNSEGLLAAAILWAIDAHLAGRRGVALGLGLAAALLRPETWPFLGLYAVWLFLREPRLRWWTVGAMLAIPLAWLGPEQLSSGHPLRAADAARGTPSTGSAVLSPHPVLTVFTDAVHLMTVPVACVAGVALVVAVAGQRHRRRGLLADPLVLLGLAALAWVAIVAAMTHEGFAGNPRYCVPAAAVAAVVAACALSRVPPRARAAAAVGLVVLVAVLQAGPLDDQRAELGRRADVRRQLDALVASEGGARALRDCGAIRAYGPTTTAVAWDLRVPLAGLPRTAKPTDVAFRERWRPRGRMRPGVRSWDLHALPVARRTHDWELRTACRLR